MRAAERREQVARLLPFLTEPQIAAQLCVSRSSVARDAARIRADARREITTADVVSIATELRFGFLARRNELWKLALTKGTAPKDKIAALRALAAEDAQLLDALQSLGVAHKAPEKVMADLRMVDAIDKLSPDALRRIATATGDDALELFAQEIGATAARELLPGLEDGPVQAEDEDPDYESPERKSAVPAVGDHDGWR
jgi:hypothetical protein